MGSGNSKLSSGGSGVVEDRVKQQSAAASTTTTASAASAAAVNDNNLDKLGHDETTMNNATVRKEEGGGGGGGCPMKHSDGSYSYDWKAFLFGAHPHGPKGNKPLDVQELEKEVTAAMGENNNNKKAGGGGCPIKNHNNNGAFAGIDPTNQMPVVADQAQAPGQSKALSTERVQSNIPKGGADTGKTWEYPSPQMFYNSLARKGKLGDTEEDDIDSVVAMHNNMNEKTWNVILQWEKTLHGDNEDTKLLSFLGRPQDLSPKAAFKHYVLGHRLPYDRHDWTVLRSDGTLVRYVIDYYHDESRTDVDMPRLDDENATPSLLVDVRPALDTPMRVVDRVVRMPLAYNTDKTTMKHNPYLPLFPTNEMKEQVQESLDIWTNIQQRTNRDDLSKTTVVANNEEEEEHDDEEYENYIRSMVETMTEERAKELATNFSRSLKDCVGAQQKVDACGSEDECRKASVDLTLCLGKIMCPVQHTGLQEALKNDNDDGKSIELALETMTSCVFSQTDQRQAAKEKYPQYFSE